MASCFILFSSFVQFRALEQFVLQESLESIGSDKEQECVKHLAYAFCRSQHDGEEVWHLLKAQPSGGAVTGSSCGGFLLLWLPEALS